MLSAVIPSGPGYPAMRLAPQPEHQRSVHPGPLVLGTDPLKSPAPTADRDRTVSRRSKPSSRATFPVYVDYWGRSACYPRRTFYPMSDGPSIRDHRITKTWFPTCSTCRSRSQAPLCLCTLRLVSNQPEGTFARLRYSFGGDRPSQTTHHAVSPIRMTDPG
jgi:hypothetical protein